MTEKEEKTEKEAFKPKNLKWENKEQAFRTQIWYNPEYKTNTACIDKTYKKNGEYKHQKIYLFPNRYQDLLTQAQSLQKTINNLVDKLQEENLATEEGKVN